MGIKQYKVGKSWEEEIINYYNKKGYFTYKIPTVNEGTVFDIIVLKNGAALCIECKHITGNKLHYKGSGLLKKTDEIEHFIKTTGNNIYIYVKSDIEGCFWTTWARSSELLKEQGYLSTKDMFKANLNDVDNIGGNV